MANDINIVVLVGRLTRDSELKYTSGGTAVSRFSLAVNRYAGKDKGEEVSFFEIIVWGKLAESLNPYLTKGKQISVSGELRQNRWEQDGVNRSKVEIHANSLQLLGGGKDSPASTTQGPQNQSYPQNANNYQQPSAPRQGDLYGPKPSGFDPPSGPQGFAGPEHFNDDIPF